MSQLERIVETCGGVLLDNGRRALICGPGHGRKDRSVSLLETEDGRILIHCFSPRDHWRDVRNWLAARGLLAGDGGHPDATVFDRPGKRVLAQPQCEDRIARAKRWWEQATPIKGTIAEHYLRNRAISGVLPSSDVLRFHSRMTSLDDKERRPALLAAILDCEGALQGVQATLLSARGAGKATVPTPRRTIGRLLAGAVRLTTHQSILVVCEGVETALSAGEALSLPAWAALSADNLARFEPPAEVRRLVVACDADPAGLAAARAISARVAHTIKVDVATPPDGANDWNDWARQHRQE